MASLPKTYADIRWVYDLDPMGADTASDLEGLEQDVLHIIVQLRGSNIADPDKGAAAPNYLSGTSGQLAALPALIDAQLSQVSRIQGSQTTMSQQSNGTYLISVQIAVGAQVVNLNYTLGPNGVQRA